jgi:hypothetical protein
VPVACSQSVLTGTDGMFAYKPAGTSVCLLDFTDFTVLGSKVKLPTTHGFRPGDAVSFVEENGGSLDTGLTAGDVYYLGAVTETDAVILDALGGTPVPLEGDGGTGTADTPGGHIGMQFADFQALCQIAGWDISMTRDKIPTSSLKCRVGGAASKFVSFKTYQAGFADGTGTVRVQFTADQTSLAQRMLEDSLRNNQEGARGKFYINAVAGAAADGMPDDDQSLFIEAPLSLEGVSLGVDSEATAATIATVNFSISGLPKHLFSTPLY